MFKLYMRSMRWQWHHPWKWFFLNVATYAVIMGGWRTYCAHVDRKNTEFDREMDMLKQQRERREALHVAAN